MTTTTFAPGDRVHTTFCDDWPGTVVEMVFANGVDCTVCEYDPATNSYPIDRARCDAQHYSVQLDDVGGDTFDAPWVFTGHELTPQP